MGSIKGGVQARYGYIAYRHSTDPIRPIQPHIEALYGISHIDQGKDYSTHSVTRVA